MLRELLIASGLALAAAACAAPGDEKATTTTATAHEGEPVVVRLDLGGVT